MLVKRPTGQTGTLAQWSRWDREVDHRPDVRADVLRGWEAWRKLLLFVRLQEQEQPPDNISDPRFPARLPLSTLPRGAHSGPEGYA